MEIKSIGLYCIRLRKLTIKECPHITDVGLLALSNKCISLETIVANKPKLDFKITDVGLLALGDRLQYLKEIVIPNCSVVSDVGLTWLAHGCPGITVLNINYCDKVTDAGLRSLSERCVMLSHLHIKNCKRVSDVGIRLIANGCRDMRYMDMGGLTLLTDGMHQDFGVEGIIIPMLTALVADK